MAPHLLSRGAAPRAPHRTGAARPGSVGRSPADDPVGERSRARDAGAGGVARGRALRAGLARLFADIAGLRQAAPRGRPDDARPGVRLGRRALRARDRRGACRRTRNWSSRSRRHRAAEWSCSRRSRRRGTRARWTKRTRRYGPDSISKFLLTSGSTGMPKAVIHTQRMLTSNQQMLVDCLPLLAAEPPVLVDWLPWNHTFGGNHNYGLTLYNGGTLYIDEGKPTAQLIGETLRNLREIAPTVYFNVPRGFEEIAHALHADAELARKFLQPREDAVLRRGEPVPADLGQPARGGRTHLRRAHPDDHRPGHDRDRAVRGLRQLGSRPLGRHRPSGAGRGNAPRARRGQAGSALPRAQRHARILAARGPHAELVRRRTAFTAAAMRSASSIRPIRSAA